MLEELRIQEVNKQIADEAENLENLKKKMEHIKKSAHVLNDKGKELICHDHAIRSGGYFMFVEDGQIEDEKLIRESELGINEQSEQKRSREKKSVTFKADRATGQESYKSIVVKKSVTVKKACSSVLLKLMQKMHKLSRNYSFIIKTMAREKRMLKESMTPLIVAPTDSYHEL